MTYDQFLDFARQKRCAVVGAGISNRPLVELLLKTGCSVTVFDRRDEKQLSSWKEQLSRHGWNPAWSCGSDYLSHLTGYDLIFRTPSLHPDEPELIAEKRRGAIVTSEMEVFFHLCPAEITAVTGSDGKTTTTTLIHRILSAYGYKSWLGGNIGTPLLDQVPFIQPGDQVVLELSSFQLLSLSQSPHTAVMTNLSPNHLDIHKDMLEYTEAKANIFAHQSFADRLILNGECERLHPFVERAKGTVTWTGNRPFGQQPLYGLRDHQLYYQENETAPRVTLGYRSDFKLPGRYNALNILSALAATEGRVPAEKAIEVVKDFGGVEHRTEWIRNIQGVDFWNSSIDSSPNRSINTLSAFKEQGRPVIMIAGGKDKKCQYDSLGAAVLDTCRGLLLYGDNSPLIRKAVEKEIETRTRAEIKCPFGEPLAMEQCSCYQEALARARELARPGDSIVLSPAGTSFDHFANFMERGDYFKKLVQEL